MKGTTTFDDLNIPYIRPEIVGSHDDGKARCRKPANSVISRDWRNVIDGGTIYGWIGDGITVNDPFCGVGDAIIGVIDDKPPANLVITFLRRCRDCMLFGATGEQYYRQ